MDKVAAEKHWQLFLVDAAAVVRHGKYCVFPVRGKCQLYKGSGFSVEHAVFQKIYYYLLYKYCVHRYEHKLVGDSYFNGDIVAPPELHNSLADYLLCGFGCFADSSRFLAYACDGEDIFHHSYEPLRIFFDVGNKAHHALFIKLVLIFKDCGGSARY